jgi:glycine cleavage system H protein
MVAIFVVLTIIVFLLIDYVVQRVEARRGVNADPPSGKALSESSDEFLSWVSNDSLTVPSSLFFHRGHSWIKLVSPTQARIGLDDFAQKVLGHVESVQFPRLGEPLRQGDPLFMVKVGVHKFFLPSPCDGIVMNINSKLAGNPTSLHSSPYELGWVCEMKPENISAGIRELLSGDDAVRWELHELNKFQQFLLQCQENGTTLSAKEFSLGRMWTDQHEHQTLNEFSKSFFALDLDRTEPLMEVL